MDEKKIIFKDLTEQTSYQFLEIGKNDDEIEMIAKKRGVVIPSPDVAFFKAKYAFVDKQNRNKCTLPKEQVDMALGTLVGKPIDFDHLRKNTCGWWAGAFLEGETIISYGLFWKSNFKEEYDDIKKKMLEGKVKISFEAWGNRDKKEDGSYLLKNIHFAGGALLRDEEPAFKEAEVLEFASVINDGLETGKEGIIKEMDSETNMLWDKISEMENMMKNVQDKKEIKDLSGKIKEARDKMNSLFQKKMEMMNVNNTLDKAKTDGGVKMEEKIKTLEQEIATLKAEIASQGKVISTKDEDLVKANTLIEALKKESNDAKVKIEATEKEVAKKIEDAKIQATLVAERKSELGEIAKNVSDEDLLNEAKYENLKLKKELVAKDAEIAAIKEGKPAENMTKGSKDKEIGSDIVKKRENVQKMAWSNTDLGVEE
jgi:hypothetical protein